MSQKFFNSVEMAWAEIAVVFRFNQKRKKKIKTLKA